jgi:soluble lytic murein transglycosylase-like protein
MGTLKKSVVIGLRFGLKGLEYALVASAIYHYCHLVVHAEQVSYQFGVHVADSVVSELAETAGYVKPPEVLSEADRQAVIRAAALKHGVSPTLLRAQIKIESTNNADAHSIKGARGLMQIMPSNAQRCGLSSVAELWDEEKNIDCGAQIVSEELRNYKGNVISALMVYNGSPRALKYNYPESVNYASNVIKEMAKDLG